MRLQGGQKEAQPNLPAQVFDAASGPLLANAFERQRQLMGGHEP